MKEVKAINRREALKRSAYVLGTALMAPTVAGVLQGCSPRPDLPWTPTFFSEDQARLINTVSDIIMPKTDTPAASELGVPGFIEQLVSTIYSAEDQERFMNNLAIFEMGAAESMSKSFNKLSPEEQEEYVQSQHSKIANQRMSKKEQPFIWQVKELVITGYCLTEVGATQLLQHVMIPTRYDGCIPLSEAGNGKTWSMR
jgi:hypothetical protein